MTTVREANLDDRAAVASVLNAAMLELDEGELAAAIEPEGVLVATSDEGTVVGAAVLDGECLRQIAVRPGRRGQGVGRALVEAARARRGRLVAEFDADVCDFYESLGFEVGDSQGSGRLVGTLQGERD